MEQSCLYSIKQIWGLVPQPVKAEYRVRFAVGLLMKGKAWDTFCKGVGPHWFERYDEGLHLTWQQALACYGIDKALKGDVPARLSIVSGHGIGKSMLLSIIILWFLFIHPDCQIGCTSPGKEQMYDVLWKELKKWIDKMPTDVAALYAWESSHIRMVESPATWFARAKTASKENTEALAGLHADWVLIAVDEASGVDEPIFETMEGALTSGNILVIIISNGTRSLGYFYDTHHKDAVRWQNYGFSSLDSPRVDRKYVDGIVNKYGEDSIQYAIRVKGEFPDEGIMDDKGYVQLFNESDLHIIPFNNDWKPVGRVRASLDASGEGQDTSDWAIRDGMRAAIVAEEQVSTPASMAVKSLTVCDKYEVDPLDLVIDSFGKGSDVSMEIALATSKQKRPWRVTPVNIGEPCPDPTDRLLYVNIRAMIYYKFMLWCRKGNEIMDSTRLKEELMSIRFKRTLTGRIQIMDKVTMKKLGFPSPNKADALSMLFLRHDHERKSIFGDDPALARERETADQFDPNQTMQ